MFQRIEELRALEAGWLEGKGKAPSSDELDWLCQTFEQQFPDDLPLPHVYPTPEGGLQLEWSLGAVEATLEVRLSEQRAEWHQLNTETDEDQTEEVSLKTDDGWQRAAELVRAIAGEGT